MFGCNPSFSPTTVKVGSMNQQIQQTLTNMADDVIRYHMQVQGNEADGLRQAFQQLLVTFNENQERESQNPVLPNQTQNQRTDFQNHPQRDRMENGRRQVNEPLMCGDDFDDFEDEPCRNGPACWFFQRNRCKFSHENDAPAERNRKKEEKVTLEEALAKMKVNENNLKEEIDNLVDGMEDNNQMIANYENQVEIETANHNIWKAQNWKTKLTSHKLKADRIETDLKSKVVELEEVQVKVCKLNVLERRVEEVVRGEVRRRKEVECPVCMEEMRPR